MGFSSPSDGGRPLDLVDPGLPVSGIAMCYPQGHVVPLHRHRSGHLIYADQGLLQVEAATGQWLVPPTSAVWLRPDVPHRLRVPVALQAHGIFVRQDFCARLPAIDCVVQVSGLVRELIVTLTRLGQQAQASHRVQLLGELLIEEVHASPHLPLHLPWPGDARVQKICQMLVQDPGHAATAQDWAAQCAMSEKTLHRRFLQSTGMTFGKWRQQLRLMSSLALLMQGMPITQVALASGYDSHSAYATAFRRQFGQSPSTFAQAAQRGG